jgi:BirA family biotin operon repressor/biotin-[acetyl-CoA-carboxylase] ligase
MATPYATLHHASTTSTQDDARAAFAGRPLLVTADRQVAGRGRSGRKWLQAPRAVAASLAVAPTWPPSTWSLLTLVAGLAALDAIDDDRVSVDWPNDLVIGDDKVGGLLAESSSGVAVIGLGINLWWPDAPAGMAGLHPSDPGPAMAAAVAAAFTEAVLAELAEDPQHWDRDRYVARCITLSQSVTWESGAGTAVGIARDGALVVETTEGPVELRSGEVGRVVRATVPPMRSTE